MAMTLDEHIERLEKIINRTSGADHVSIVNTINNIRQTQILQQIADIIKTWRTMQ